MISIPEIEEFEKACCQAYKGGRDPNNKGKSAK